MLFASFNDSCTCELVGSLKNVFKRLSKFSLPVELPLLALNDEQIDAFPNELYPILLNDGASSIILLFFDDEGCSASNL